jgi:predicted DNA-binding mobile mystery protein A
MRPEFRTLRARQLERALEAFAAAKNSPRPQKGWLRAIREATGISLRVMATRMKKTPTLAAKLEKSEAEDRITLMSLRDAADALGCRLVYPRTAQSESSAAHLNRGTRCACRNSTQDHEACMTAHAVLPPFCTASSFRPSQGRATLRRPVSSSIWSLPFRT